MINRIIPSWSIKMKFTTLAKTCFINLMSNDHYKLLKVNKCVLGCGQGYFTFFACWLILRVFLLSADLKKKKSGIPSVSNSLEPDQAQHYVRPDLGQNCFQR